MSETTHQQIAELAQLHGHSPEECLSMLRAIDAPGDLAEMIQIAGNLVDIWPQLPIISDGNWTTGRMEGWTRICLWLQQDSEEIRRLLPPKYPDEHKKWGALSGRLTKYPLYCALWSVLPAGKRVRILQHLRGQLIYARDCWRRLAAQEAKKYDSVLQDSSRWVRRLSKEMGYQVLLDSLPESPCCAQDYLHAVANLLRGGQPPGCIQPIQVFIRMLEYASGSRGGYGRQHQGEGEVNETEVSHSTIEFYDPEDDREEAGWRQIEQTVIQLDKKNTARQAGIWPEEVGNRIGFFHSRESLTVDRGDSFQVQAIRERSRRRQIAVHNLNLPWRWDRLNLHDVLHLLHGLGDLLRRRIFPRWTLERRAELATLVSVMYWTASTVERALQARFVDAWGKLPRQVNSNQALLYLVWPDKEQAGWLLAAPHLPQRRLAKDGQKVYLRSSDDRVFLPLHPYAAKLIRPWMRRRFKAAELSLPLFTTDKENLIGDFKEFLRHINRSRQTRLTSQRVANHLFQVLSNDCGDETEAMLITGRFPPAGQKAALYYHAPSKQILAEQYARTCSRIIEAVLLALGRKKERLPIPVLLPELGQGHVGSRLCLEDESVRRLAEDLKNAIANHRKRLKIHAESMIDFHNAYTTYCLWMLLFATGYRSVRDPFHNPREIDWDTGYAVICDKDGDDFFNSRLVWLPPLCLQQLRYYLQHRQGMVERLWILNPQTADALADPADPPLFFYLDREGDWQAVSPASLKRHSEWCYDLPLNANRHYLRTRLRELDVPGEIVDAFMGHWEHGQEPFGTYGTLTPMSYRDLLQPSLEQLLKETGWNVLRGVP